MPILWGQPRSLIARIYICVFLLKRHRYVLHPFLHFGRASSLNRDDRLRLRAPGDFSLSAGHPKEERGVVKFRRMRWAKFSITFAAAVNVELCSRFTLAFPALFLHKNIQLVMRILLASDDHIFPEHIYVNVQPGNRSDGGRNSCKIALGAI